MNMTYGKLLSARQHMPCLVHKNLELHASTRLFFKNEILQYTGLHNYTPSNPYTSLSWRRVIASQRSTVWNRSSMTPTKYLTTSWNNISTQTPQIFKLGAALKIFVKTSLKVILGSVLLLGGTWGLFIAKIAFIDDDLEPVRSEGPRAPTLKAQITKDWLEYILTQYEEKKICGTKVEVKDFHVDIGINPGDAYNSTIFKVDIDATIEEPTKKDAMHHISSGAIQDESKIKWDHSYHLMVKTCGAKFDDFVGQYAMGFSPRETEAYVSVIPELNQFLEANGYREFQISVPNLIYSKCNKEEFVLVMENLKESGYQSYPKTKFLDLYHAKVAVENLAKLHAVSYIYDKTHDFQKKFSRFVLTDFHILTLEMMNEQFIDITTSYLKSKEDHLHLGNKLEKNKENLLKRYGEMLRDKHSNKIMCLNHGDYWVNNFMIKYAQEEGSERKIDQLKMFDMQLMHWNTSVLDLHFLLSFSTRREFRKEHLEEVLRHYHATFCEATAKMRALPLNWTYEQFKKEYDRCTIYGFVRGLSVLNVAFSESFKEIKKDNYVIKEESYSEPTPLQRKIAYKSMNFFFNSKKLLDVAFYLMALPIRKELKSGENKLLNDLIVDIVTDADEFGLLDCNHDNV